MNYNLTFRIKKYDDGWVSEIRKPVWTLFGIKYKWTHYISVFGILDKPWYFHSREMAEEETIRKFKIGLITMTASELYHSNN